jgi:hypothetical protein
MYRNVVSVLLASVISILSIEYVYATTILDWSAEITKIKNKKNAGLLGHSARITGSFAFDETKFDYADSNVKRDYSLITTSFTIWYTHGKQIFNADVAPTDTEGLFKNDYKGKRDELRFKHEGEFKTLTYGYGGSVKFEEIEIKLEDKNAIAWDTVNILDAALVFKDINFDIFEKNEFELKLELNNDLKLEGFLTNISIDGANSLAANAAAEPETLLLMSIGLMGLGFTAQRRRAGSRTIAKTQ